MDFPDLKSMVDYIASRRRKGGEGMIKTYTWTVNGTDANGEKWTTKGEYAIEPSDFPVLFDLILRKTFEQLTHGRAIYDRPGVACKGPYDYTSILIVRK